MSENAKNWAGKTIVVFGATGGIGQSLCAELHAKDAKLFLVARDAEKLEALAKKYSGARTFTCDVTQSEAVQKTFSEIEAEASPIYGVAHCVGSILLRPAHLTKDEDWAAVIGLNLTSAFYVLRSALLSFNRTQTPGSVVFCSTAAARIGLANHEAIAAAKAGLEGLIRATAATYAAKGIRVNAVAPGLVETPLSARITGNESALRSSLALHPVGRVGQPEDIASALLWFLDPAQTWVTGQILAVDGGLAGLKTMPPSQKNGP